MLNIAKNIYVGYDSTKIKYELPEAEVIPYGNSANEKRKIGSMTAKYSTMEDYENIPLPGFTLHKTDRKNWGSVDQTWLVIDPRGFLVRIGSQNLESILHVSGITEGLIQEKCIWARENTETKMILVPVSSKNYLEAVANTELIEGKVSMQDVQIGDMVLLQNKLQGIYLGTMSLYGPLADSARNIYKPQVFLRRHVVEITPGRYHYQSDVKILKVLDKAKSALTRVEAVNKVNQGINSGMSFFSSGSDMSGKYYGTRGKISLASVDALPKLPITFEEISAKDAEHLFYSAYAENDIGMLMIEDHTGAQHLIDFPYFYSMTFSVADVNSFAICTLLPVDMNDTLKLTIAQNRKSSMYHSSTIQCFSLDKFVKFYKIVKHVKDKTYV